MIDLQDVTKKYRNGRGISSLTFHIERGECFGYLGPNGAGKSTTIRTLMGFLKPNRGQVYINGLDCWQDAPQVQRLVGYLPGEIGFLDGLRGVDFLNLLSRMRRLRDLSKRKKLIDRFELDVNLPIRKMSKGTKQKIAIIAAFMHGPQVLVLDEPTSGLDPLMQLRFLELVEEEQQRGTTILMSSHNFSEVERVCQRVAIIKEGELAAVEEVKAMKALQRKVFTVQLAASVDAVTLEQSGCHILKQRGTELEIEIRGNYNDFVQALAQCNVISIDTRELTLEEVFLHYYQS
jgi:ABC-2 type transport system ATP-binding protein